MSFKLATAFVEIGARDKQMRQGFRSSQQFLTGALRQIGSIAGGLGLAFTFGGLISSSKQAITLAERQIQAETRLAAVLKATGGAAGFTADELKKFAASLQASTTISDEEILESMAVLATFKTVTGDVFRRATEAAADLSATGFGGIQGAMVQMAKALEDPIRGLTALRRSGVSFSEEQKKQIKQLVETNQLQKAQALILDAVEGQVKGVARELAKTDIGKYKQLQNQLGDLREQMGNAVLPVFVKFREVQLNLFVEILPAVEVWANAFSGGMDHVGESADDLSFSFANLRKAWLEVYTPQFLPAFFGKLKEGLASVPAALFESGEGMFTDVFLQAREDAEKAVLEWARTGEKIRQDRKRMREEFNLPTGREGAGAGGAGGGESAGPRGFFGFEELSRRFQEQTLKAADPQKKMVGLMERDQLVQARMAQALERVAQNTEPGNNPLGDVGLAAE